MEDNTVLIGVDPGISPGANSGGIALLCPDNYKVWPMPSMKIKHGRVTDNKGLRDILRKGLFASAYGYEEEVTGYIKVYIEEPILGVRFVSPQLWENYGACRQAFTDHWFEVVPITPADWQLAIYGWTFRDRSKAIGKKLFQANKPQLLYDKAVRVFGEGTGLKTKRETIHTGTCAAVCIAEAGRLLCQ